MPPVVLIQSVAQTSVCACRFREQDSQTEVCATEIWLGRKDSNLRMPDPKTGALPLGDAPKSWPGEARQNLARCAHRASIVVAPNRATWKDAPTSLKFHILNGALLRILVVKNPKYRRAASGQQ